MKKKIIYTDEPLGNLEVIKDFLPSPKQLILREGKIKVTISLSKYSVDYFKAVAKDNNSKYQKMIRNVLDHYASQFPHKPSASGSSRTKLRRAG